MECENNLIAILEQGQVLKKDEILGLFERVTAILETEPNIIHIEAPVTIIPLLKGNLKALKQYLKASGSPPQTQFLFFGNYGNRGNSGPEALSYVLALKEMYPHRIILLRTAMDSTEARLYGLYEQLRYRYASVPVYKAALKLFSCLPIAAVINKKVYCGGLAPNLMTLEAISQVNRRSENIYDYGALEDYFTAVPSEKSNEWFTGNVRLLEYGRDVVKKFCDDNGMELIIRSLQNKEGNQTHTTSKFYGKIVTIWPGSIIHLTEEDGGKIATKIVNIVIDEEN